MKKIFKLAKSNRIGSIRILHIKCNEDYSKTIEEFGGFTTPDNDGIEINEILRSLKDGQIIEVTITEERISNG